MSEWHSEQARRPWEEDKNFPISIHQDREGRVSTREGEDEQDGIIRRKKRERIRREYFNTHPVLTWNPCTQFGEICCELFNLDV